MGDLRYRWWRQRTTWSRLGGFLDAFEGGQVRYLFFGRNVQIVTELIDVCIYLGVREIVFKSPSNFGSG